MSEDQITKVPGDLEASTSKPPPRVKDPKKVAAGKALAKKNREARESLKKMESKEEAKPLTFSDANSWLFLAAGVARGCLTLYHAYNLFFPAVKPDKPEGEDLTIAEKKGPDVDDARCQAELATVDKSRNLIDME